MNTDVYSPREIALAAGVPEEQVVAALGGSVRTYVLHSEAVRVGRLLARRQVFPAVPPATHRLFALFSDAPGTSRPNPVPLAVSSTLHVGAMLIAVFIATFNLAPRAATLPIDAHHADPMRLVFVATPGPGGGGGGGGLLQKAPPPKAMRQGHHTISSPLPKREPPKPIEPVPAPPEPKPAP